MDIRNFFGSSSSKSATSSLREGSESEEDSTNEAPPSKRPCAVPSSAATSQKYNKKWAKDFPWLEYDGNFQGAFCKICRKVETRGQSLQGSGGVWVTKPFQNWKKAVQKMKAHASSESHLRQVEAELIVSRGETVVHQLQCFGDSERKNQKAIKALLGCTHYLCKLHIPHTTNFSKLIDLIVSCGEEDLEEFVRKAAKNASCTSTDAVTDFVEAIGLWVDELQVNRVCNVPFFSLMADECVDVANIEELSVYCRWVENGVPVEHFMEILPLKKTNAQSIYSVLLDWLKKKDLQCSKLRGMGFDGAATFAGKKSGMQASLKKHALIQSSSTAISFKLACVQSANSTKGIKHVYTIPTTLWKFFHYSPKRCQNLKEIQKVLDIPELKIVKPSDTRWLSHEKYVSTAKKCYGAIVSALETIYQESHEPEALGISRILSKHSTLFAIYLLDYILPEVSKLSKSLLTEKLDLSIISSLVDATLHTLEDILQPAAKWVLDLQEVKEEMDITVGINFNSDDVASFQSRVGEPFYTKSKENIVKRFVSKDVVSCFSIFDPKKTPNSLENCTYGEDQVKVLLEHYGSELPAETVVGDEFLMPAVITSSSDQPTEWKTFRRYITNQPREDIKEQLKELSTNSMMQTTFPNLSILANICLIIPVGTASVERSFSPHENGKV